MTIYKEIRGTVIAKGKMDIFLPKTTISIKWKHSKSPVKYAPGKMVYGGIYYNREGLLPDAPGRIWFEADLNYYNGKRNGHRVLWSNDGLMFVTYNHYESIIEVVGG